MDRRISINTLKKIEEFEEKGYVQHTGNILRMLRKNPNMRIFRGSMQRSVGGGCNKYSIYDFFRKMNFHFLYNIERKEEFAKYLYSIFNTTNPHASQQMRSAFSRLLSQNYLKTKT